MGNVIELIRRFLVRVISDFKHIFSPIPRLLVRMVSDLKHRFSPNGTLQQQATSQDGTDISVIVHLLSGKQITLSMESSKLVRDLKWPTLKLFMGRVPYIEDVVSWDLMTRHQLFLASNSPLDDTAKFDGEPLWEHAQDGICNFMMIYAGEPVWCWEDRYQSGCIPNAQGSTSMCEVLRHLTDKFGKRNFQWMKICQSRDDLRAIMRVEDLTNTTLRSFVEHGWCIFIKDVENERDYFTFTVRRRMSK